jgi:hypothetical protein
MVGGQDRRVLCDSAVTVRVEENVVAFLTTGQILMHKPTREQFAKTTSSALKWGAEVNLKRLEEAYFQVRVISKKQYESVIRLMSVFAQHLSSLSNQPIVEKDTAESPAVTRARVFMMEHHSDPVALADAARALFPMTSSVVLAGQIWGAALSLESLGSFLGAQTLIRNGSVLVRQVRRTALLFTQPSPSARRLDLWYRRYRLRI